MVLLNGLLKAQVPVMGTISGPTTHIVIPPIGPVVYSVTASNSPTSYTWSVLVPSASTSSAIIFSGQGTSSAVVYFYPCGQTIYTLSCIASNSTGVALTVSAHQTTVSELYCNISTSFQQSATSNATICIGNSISAYASGAYSYGWQASTTQTFNASLYTPSNSHVSIGTATFSPTVTTVYTVTGYCYGGMCNQSVVTLTLNVDNCISLTEKTKNNTQLIVYPNPAKEIIYIEFYKTPKKVELCDIYGTILPMKLSISDNLITLNIEDFLPGIYFASVEFDDKVLTKKIVIN